MQLTEVYRVLYNWIEANGRRSFGNPNAAVLVPFFEKQDKVHLLLTVRSSNLSKHSGQISFPGGKVDDTDEGIIYTALRETEEEVGLDNSSIDVIGEFDDFKTPYYPAVTPVIGFLNSTDFHINSEEEIEEILEVPLIDLLDPEIYHSELWEYEGTKHPIHFYEWTSNNGRTYTIWGATAWVINDIINVLEESNSNQ